jgi:hypothetical protein
MRFNHGEKDRMLLSVRCRTSLANIGTIAYLEQVKNVEKIMGEVGGAPSVRSTGHLPKRAAAKAMHQKGTNLPRPISLRRSWFLFCGGIYKYPAPPEPFFNRLLVKGTFRFLKHGRL